MTKPQGSCILCTLHKQLHKHRERGRSYLLPGMGGRALKRKNQKFLRWSLATGVITSLLLGTLLWLLSRR